LRAWNFIGDRWESYPLPLTNSLDEPLNSNKISSKLNNNNDISFRKLPQAGYEITAFEMDWGTNELFVGDCEGTVLIYDFNSLKLKKEINTKIGKITRISLGRNFFAVACVTGASFLYERNLNLESFIRLEEDFNKNLNSKLKTGT